MITYLLTSGIGVMERADGTVLKGTWLKNVLHGKVITTLHDGTKFEEMWHNGKKKTSKDLREKEEGKSPMDSMDDLINGVGSQREQATNKILSKSKGNKNTSEKKEKKKRKKQKLKQQNKKHTSNTRYEIAPPANTGTEEKLNPTEMVDVGL
mmetsp:Transcript_19516/g.30987  ORF Transcript_19516/g.30987 Transcript_19516/m.30987 type:complete len:152 (-) Transcript_19516:102-557(-)